MKTSGIKLNVHGEYGVIDKEFWKNKKVLITGHTGFKGSWLVSILLKYGAKVTGYSKIDSKIASSIISQTVACN